MGRDAGRELSTISSLDQEVIPKLLPQNLQTHEHPLFTPGVGTVLDPLQGPGTKERTRRGQGVAQHHRTAAMRVARNSPNLHM